MSVLTFCLKIVLFLVVIIFAEKIADLSRARAARRAAIERRLQWRSRP